MQAPVWCPHHAGTPRVIDTVNRIPAVAHLPSATPMQYRSYEQLFVTADELALGYAAIFPSEDPWSAQAGVHQLSVNGKQSGITDGDLLTVADRFGIGTAKRVLAEVKAALELRHLSQR